MSSFSISSTDGMSSNPGRELPAVLGLLLRIRTWRPTVSSPSRVPSSSSARVPDQRRGNRRLRTGSVRRGRTEPADVIYGTNRLRGIGKRLGTEILLLAECPVALRGGTSGRTSVSCPAGGGDTNLRADTFTFGGPLVNERATILRPIGVASKS